MVVIKNIGIISSIYLIISGIISLFFLITIIVQNGIYGIFWFTMPLFLTIIIITIFNNYRILRFPGEVNKKNFLINCFITAFQAVYIAIDGFQFKYNQGLQIVAYFKIFSESKEMKAGMFFNGFNFLLNIKYLELNYSVFGIDLLAGMLFLFYFYQFKNKR